MIIVTMTTLIVLTEGTCDTLQFSSIDSILKPVSERVRESESERERERAEEQVRNNTEMIVVMQKLCF